MGPNLYAAYAQKPLSKNGSTKLHLDISDAVNILMHLSKPGEETLEMYSTESILSALEDADADEFDKSQLRNDEPKLPGAIWHIFRPDQTERMCEVLRKDAERKGHCFGANDHPIHDQNIYVYKELRKL